MKLSDELKQKAINLGLCELWQNAWGNPNDDLLIMKYIKGIHWCMERNYPSVSYIVEKFGDELLGEYSIYADKKAISENKPTIIIRGSSVFDISYDYYNVGTVWVGNESSVTIRAKDNSIVNVHVYDKAKVNIIKSDSAKVKVYKHSDTLGTDKNTEIIY